MSAVVRNLAVAEAAAEQRLSKSLVTRLSPALHAMVLVKQKHSGIAISEVLRRALRLWVRGELDELLQDAGE